MRTLAESKELAENIETVHAQLEAKEKEEPGTAVSELMLSTMHLVFARNESACFRHMVKRIAADHIALRGLVYEDVIDTGVVDAYEFYDNQFEQCLAYLREALKVHPEDKIADANLIVSYVIEAMVGRERADNELGGCFAGLAHLAKHGESE
jgi:hypothetical protein